MNDVFLVTHGILRGFFVMEIPSTSGASPTCQFFLTTSIHRRDRSTASTHSSTIRLHLPIIFTTRVLEKDMSFDTGNGEERMTLPKGTKTLISPSAIHSDERNFERAREFIPERWVRWDGDRWVDRDYEKVRKAGIATPAAPSSSPSQDQSPKLFFF